MHLVEPLANQKFASYQLIIRTNNWWCKQKTTWQIFIWSFQDKFYRFQVKYEMGARRFLGKELGIVPLGLRPFGEVPWTSTGISRFPSPDKYFIHFIHFQYGLFYLPHYIDVSWEVSAFVKQSVFQCLGFMRKGKCDPTFRNTLSPEFNGKKNLKNKKKEI